MGMIDGLVASLERAGGYAALTGLILIGLFWLTRSLISEQGKRQMMREQEMVTRYSREMEREHASATEHREDKQLLIGVVQENSRAQTALVGAVEKLTDTQVQTNERLIAIDRHLGRKASVDA